MTRRELCWWTILLVVAITAPRGLAGTTCDASLNYLDLSPTVEKWFTSDYPGKDADLRMHTSVLHSWNGIPVQRREILLGNDVIDRKDLLFAREADGDILFYGDLLERTFSTPLLWVNAPLWTGKSWVGQLPALDGSQDPEQMIHYVFAVLDRDEVNCNGGTVQAYRVLVTTVHPDGETTNCNFWYNESCGLVRCCMENQRVYLLQKVIRSEGDTDRDLDDPVSLLPAGAASVPNPANPRTEIRWEMTQDALVTIEIHDVSGRRVRTLCSDEAMQAGSCVAPWDGLDDRGSPSASGVYLYRVRAGGESARGRVALVR